MKTNEAVKYMISVWDEVAGNWREKPDHVQQKFLEAEKEINQPTKQRCMYCEKTLKPNEAIVLCKDCTQ